MSENKTITDPPATLNGHAPGESVEALNRRVSELEAALAKLTRQRDETRRMFFELHAEMFPDDPPPTEEELLDEKKTRTEVSISEMIGELVRGAGAKET